MSDPLVWWSDLIGDWLVNRWYHLPVYFMKHVKFGVSLTGNCVLNISTQLENFDSDTITTLKFQLQNKQLGLPKIITVQHNRKTISQTIWGVQERRAITASSLLMSPFAFFWAFYVVFVPNIWGKWTRSKFPSDKPYSGQSVTFEVFFTFFRSDRIGLWLFRWLGCQLTEIFDGMPHQFSALQFSW